MCVIACSKSSLSEFINLVSPEWDALHHTLYEAFDSHIHTIPAVGRYLLDSGGKRIRPLLLLLCAKACDTPDTAPVALAAVIECIHTATLLHDDVVDGAALRRGRLTANHVWDNASAILVGDFLYSRAFQMMVHVNNMVAMQILADATNRIAEGEIRQLSLKKDLSLSITQYLEVITYKTAKLFEASAELGAIMSHPSKEIQQALAHYGLHLGLAFQLIDDLLDYTAPHPNWGKLLGTDLQEGKITLPLLYAMQQVSPSHKQFLQQALQTGNLDVFSEVQTILSDSGALAYTQQLATEYAEKAQNHLSLLPPSPYQEALYHLATFAITRRS